MSDAALKTLLAGEIERRMPLLTESEPDPGEVRAALHSLKGSAAMAGYLDLATVIAQLGARVRSGDPSALRSIREIIEEVLARLRRGERPFDAEWPEPPPGLGPSQVDERFRSEYLAAMRDRLGEVDAALASTDAAPAAIEHAYRSVHAMKGAAGAVGDDATAWYCHGLEARLKRVMRAEEKAEDALVDLARHRAVIALLLEDPAHAFETLRALAARRPSSASAPPSAPSHPPPAHDEEQDETLRVPALAVDRFLERLERMDLVHQELLGTADAAQQVASRLRDLRAGLLEALRLIGPPKPWGAPAAALRRIESAVRTLGGAADNAARGGAQLRRQADALHTYASASRSELTGLRRTTVGWLFERVAHAVERLAAREGRLVRVELSGMELPMDRRAAERLFDPVMQLARNAVAHGIRPPEERLDAGMPAEGCVKLAAERIGDWLRLVVEDDGSGVDVAQVRQLAVERGAVTAEAAGSLHEDELLSLLFLPGLTTRDGADLLAGRGVGLDLAQDALRRLGGAIRLSRGARSGLVATVEVPSESGMVEVVWLRAAEQEFALPVTYASRIAAIEEKPAATLAACLGLTSSRQPELAVELSVHGVQPVMLGVEQVGDVEDVGIRALPALVAAAGPYSGAVLRGDGSLRLALDAALLAARAWSASI